MSIKAMKLTLEALERYEDGQQVYFDDEIEALRAAIEQAEKQEPVLWAAKESMFMWGKSDESGHPYHIICKGQRVRSHQIPLYTAPPQREWRGLSVGDRFAHRLAVMLECALLDPTGTWDDAHALLDEYHEALYERDRALGLPYVSGFGKD